MSPLCGAPVDHVDRPEVYTQEGMDWIDDNQMGTVILRHFPALRPYLRTLDNAFVPWPRAGTARS